MQRLNKVRSADVTLGVTVALAIAAFYLVAACVDFLLTPFVALFIGDRHFELNSFTISAVEFRYGAVLQAGLTVVLALAGGWYLIRRVVNRSDGKPCSECTEVIPADARRCPHCTAAQVGGAPR